MAKNVPNSSQRDIEELENAFRKLSDSKRRVGKYASKKKGIPPAFITIVGAVVLIIAAVVGILLYNSHKNNQQISANITIAGQDVSGMTRKDAELLLENIIPILYEDRQITVKVEDQTIVIPYSVARPTLDHEAAVDAAMSYIPSKNGTHAFDITPYMTFNRKAIRAELNRLTTHFSSNLVQTTYEITGTAPEFLNKIDENANVVLQIHKGVPGKRLNIDDLYHEVVRAFSEGRHDVSYTCQVTDPDPIDWETILKDHKIDPVEAQMDEATFEVSGGTYGYACDPAEAAAAEKAAEYGETVTVPYQWIKPENTAEELESVLFRDVLATYTTYASYDYNRNTNLELAAAACNGKILYPGDVFSFNETLGERTPDKGYRPGASYVGGETVYDYGGGICQVATTLYYCSVVSDLEIIERECHGYASSYTPLSTDATVFWNGIDYRFKNTTKYPLRIEATSSNGDVTVSFIGTDTKDYYVKFESEWLATYSYETVYKEMEADNEKGFKDGDIITTPYIGYKSQSFRARYDKETGALIERVLENIDVYSTRNEVICKIIGSEETTDPTEPTEPTIPTDPGTSTEPDSSTEPESSTEASTPTETPAPNESEDSVSEDSAE